MKNKVKKHGLGDKIQCLDIHVHSLTGIQERLERNNGQNQSRFKVVFCFDVVPGFQLLNVKHTGTVTDMEGLLKQYMQLIMYMECGM